MLELSLRTRAAAIERLRVDQFDVLVVGGGITGAGVALDAAARGLRVALVEATDFAFGTSSRSSKMIHGGLRYLASGDLPLVREGLRERRGIQLRAPHLVRPLPVLLPIDRARLPWKRMKFGTGLWAYDLLGAWRAGVRHDWISLGDLSRAAPNLDPSDLVGALSYADAQADDVSLVFSVLRTAAAHGALIVNGARVSELSGTDRLVTGAGVTVTDPGGDADQSFEVRAHVVVDATGVWSGTLRAPGADPHVRLAPSKGIHLTVPRDRAGVEECVFFYTRTGTNVFIEPWQEDLAIIGTSDEPYDGPTADPQAADDEVDRLLAIVGPMLRHPVRREDVITSWAGLRPLVRPAKEGGSSKDISRRHRTIGTPGLVTIVGGKLTTYRQMAEDTIDEVARQLRRELPPCHTQTLPLDGSDLVATQATVNALVDRFGVSRRLARHLLGRYGSGTEWILKRGDEHPGLLERIHPDRPYIAAEVLFARQFQMARTADDVIARRTRLSIETRDQGEAARERITELLDNSERHVTA